MAKENITQFDINAAFKALDELEVPKVKGLAPNRLDLKEAVKAKERTSILIEDFYDMNNNDDLLDAKEDREEEVAKAKLARIEKIVDLDADSAEDLLPSYVGKTIIQCPQCMTLFYKNEEDLVKDENDPETVNVNEPCQHCGNVSGYQLVGKVAGVEEDEMDQFDSDNFESGSNEGEEENELDLDFEEEPGNELDLDFDEPVEENEEHKDEDEEKLDLKDEEEEEEKKEESFAKPQGVSLQEQVEEALNEEKEVVDIYDGTGSHMEREANKKYISRDDELIELAKANPDKEYHYHTDDDDFKINMRGRNIKIPSNIKIVSESLQESADEDLNKKLEAHNKYIAHIQEKIDAAEKELAEEKNEEIKKLIQKTINAYKEELENALPEAIKGEQQVEELPDADEVPEEAIEGEEVEDLLSDEEEVEESLNASEFQKECEEKSELKTENESENLTLNEEQEIFPNPEKHELVKEVNDVEIYHCNDCGKYAAIINGEKIKKDSIEEIEACINGNCEEIKESKCEEADCKIHKAITHPDEDMKELKEALHGFEEVDELIALCKELGIETMAALDEFKENNPGDLLANLRWVKQQRDRKAQGLDENYRVFVAKANDFVEMPDFINFIPQKKVSDAIKQLEPEELFTVGYATPIYFYKELFDKFTLIKCTQIEGYTGEDYRDASVRNVGNDTDRADFSRAQSLNPNGHTIYGIPRMNTSNSEVKSIYGGMQKKYDDINKVVKQADKIVYDIDPATGRRKKDKNGEFIVLDTLTDLKTILFYPTPDKKPNVKYFIDLKDGKGFVHIHREDVVNKIYAKVYEIIDRGWREGVDKKDLEKKYHWSDLFVKATKVIGADKATRNDKVLSLGTKSYDGAVDKPDVRALYLNQIYYFNSPSTNTVMGAKLFESVEADDADVEELNEASDKNDLIKLDYSEEALDKMFDSKEFKTPISDSEVQKYFGENLAVEELHENSINKHISAYLKEVYSNVKDFTVDSCEIVGKSLKVEGIINFNSGNTRNTQFDFKLASKKDNKLVFEGYNKELADGGLFTLSCFLEDNEKTLMTESIKYSYKINDVLVEGLK